jgi:HSP90 family molecular chaperone
MLFHLFIDYKYRPLLAVILLYYTGVVDSEDIPLNLSRELLQDSSLIR